MARERWTVLSVWLAVLGILLAGSCAMGRETEEQLLQRIQSEQNPVKKAKDEIKLANLKFAQVQDAYSQGHIEAGAKLLGTFVDDDENFLEASPGFRTQGVETTGGFQRVGDFAPRRCALAARFGADA